MTRTLCTLRTLLAVLLAFTLTLTPVQVLSQPRSTQGHLTVPLMSDYELDSTSYIYICTYGKGAQILTDWYPGPHRITTADSSDETTDALVSTQEPFRGLAAGDELLVNIDGTLTQRYIATATSSSSVEVNAVWNLTGGTGAVTGSYGFGYRTREGGTAATDCWFPIGSLSAFSIELKIDQMNAASIDAKLDCRAYAATTTANTIWTANYTAADVDVVRVDTKSGMVGDECRFGLKMNTDDGNDLTTNAEAISVNLMVQ